MSEPPPVERAIEALMRRLRWIDAQLIPAQKRVRELEAERRRIDTLLAEPRTEGDSR